LTKQQRHGLDTLIQISFFLLEIVMKIAPF